MRVSTGGQPSDQLDAAITPDGTAPSPVTPVLRAQQHE
jgi:hypothetical protein